MWISLGAHTPTVAHGDDIHITEVALAVGLDYFFECYYYALRSYACGTGHTAFLELPVPFAGRVCVGSSITVSLRKQLGDMLVTVRPD